MGNDPFALAPGTLVAGYCIERILGSRGSGITYEAFSAVTEQRVAIEEFFPRAIAWRETATRIACAERDADAFVRAFERFEGAIAELCRVRHPSIPDVVHYVRENGTGYAIMEHIAGTPLETWLRQRSTPPSPAALQPIIDPILDALARVHEIGGLHGHIAAGNIMIRPDGRPALIAFGMGDRGDPDPSADIHAIAAVIYQALAGEPPVDADSRTDAMARHGADPYVPLAEAAPIALSRRMAATIDRALSVRAADRPRSIEELRSRLWGEDAGEDGRSGDDEDRAPARLPEASVTLPLLIDIELRSDGHLRHIDRLSLAEAGHYVIGSLPENEIQLVGGQICDEHACLVVRERDLEIINLNNEYGTYIGETSIDRAPWDGREPIRIGSYEIRFVKSA